MLPLDLVEEGGDSDKEEMLKMINQCVKSLIEANILRYDIGGRITFHSKVERFTLMLARTERLSVSCFDLC